MADRAGREHRLEDTGASLNKAREVPFGRRLADRAGVGFGLTDEVWRNFEPHLTGPAGRRGRPAVDRRRDLEAMLWVATTRRNWRELPPRYGLWNSVYRQFERWSAAGLWLKMRAQLAADAEASEDMRRLVDTLLSLEKRPKVRNDGMIPRRDPGPPERPPH
ncbi:transposase [Chelatococcus sp. SYSU_G07232]|uniref:Transposase n=1 Tax=Chelatococcus albus TaxID=3047466 RepID=A0ABT7AIA4_9HYPH|nr:transposase [Chelatococcus sp. SYSU_G07232]MDJ1159098.1 transposase [Chelatococcus sp. SYSU_G07232]